MAPASTLRLLPISGGVFAGNMRTQVSLLTVRALEAGFSQLSWEQQAAFVGRHVELCIFAESELFGFAGSLRREAKLSLSPAEYSTQEGALKQYRDLLARGHSASRLGVFAREVSSQGHRLFFVDRVDGFAADNSMSNRHLYEVILQNRPCWLYFDLEFCREANPGIDSDKVMEIFWSYFGKFCERFFGSTYDPREVQGGVGV